jgi:hypothetical protein
MTPLFKKNDLQMFKSYLDRSSVYFEYGCGGSTYEACKRPNIKKVISVESDKCWFDKIVKSVDANKSCILFSDLNSRPNTFGNPGKACTLAQMKTYSNHILEYATYNIDLILIDGRFRVSSCLKCYNCIDEKCVILFDDFLNRPSYHVILKWFYVIEQTIDKCMVALKKRAVPESCENIYDVILEYEDKPG